MSERARIEAAGAHCTVCGKLGETFGNGWCRSCRRRWREAGRPESGPPPPRLPVGTMGTCAACEKPGEIFHVRNGWCRECTRRWYKAGRPESGPPPLRSRYAAVESWRQVPTPATGREPSHLEVGTAAEHLVCADLLLQGYRAFMANQTCPYDVAVDVGSLIRIQVKSTRVSKIVQDRATEPVYKFGIARPPSRPAYVKGDFDLFALVALDIRLIAYVPLVFLPGKQVHICQPGSRRGKHFADFPFAKAAVELGLT